MADNKLYIGILTGTSMDSIDCGIYRFNEDNYEILAFYENEYPLKIKNKIKQNLKELRKNHTESVLNIDIANEFASIVNEILLKENISSTDIKAIGMHGQTISHLKENNQNISIQLGSPKILSKKTNIKVISDFRQHDIDNGGEGAPLAPLFHDYFFKSKDKKRIILNIGGISNVSLLASSNNKVSGYDTGPGNTLIDSWMRENYNVNYDNDGFEASLHKVIDSLLYNFMEDDYLKMKSPKSTTTEYFCYEWICKKLKITENNYSKGDILSTLTMFSALSILQSLKDNYSYCDEIYVCGGGAFNKTLMNNLDKLASKIFSNKVVIDTTAGLGVNPKTVETGLFAWLAMSRVNNVILDYTNVTGSNKPLLIGTIYYPM